MPVITATTQRTPPGRAGRRSALWAALLGAPSAWLVQLQANYALVQVACSTGHRWFLHGASLLFVLIAAGSGVLAFLQWRAPAGDGDPVASERARFMSLVGILASGLFTLLILVQGAANFIFDPCEI